GAEHELLAGPARRNSRVSVRAAQAGGDTDSGGPAMIREPLPVMLAPIEAIVRFTPIDEAGPRYGWHLASCGEPLDGHYLGRTQAEARAELAALNARRQPLGLAVVRVRELEI